MFWADKILENRTGFEWINDAWTPSGIVHMGGLKGPVIHDVLYKILRSQGKECTYTFGFDDMDAIDGLPASLQEQLGSYMGIPVCDAPAPDGNGTFGQYYGDMMRSMFQELGIEAQIYLASDYYRSGKYDEAIRFVLDHAQEIRDVYAQMYKKEVPNTWFPLQIVCPTCHKVGTTTVISWDGNEVEFECSPTKVQWAQGCGLVGKVAPFGGNATMPFKVEWAAKWWVFKVTIEGAGKDHASAGGTYDIARKLVKDVFGQDPPVWLPYEFFLYDGKKMSSSKGLGLTGQELLEVLPPQIVRFLMIKTAPNTAVEFNPYGTQIIPKLYEDYVKAAAEYEAGTGSDMARAFELSAVGELKSPPKFRFLTLAQWVQMPNMEEEIEKEGLTEWAKYVKVWVEKYAPESDKFLIQKELPNVSSLSDQQREYLKKLQSELNPDMSAEQLQEHIYNLAQNTGISTKDAFQAIYISFLGKDHGPKAAWLLNSLDPEFVKNRLLEASQ